jgi:hypothetical protein
MFRLIFSKLYHSDLDESHDYISNKLQNRMAADRLIMEAKKKIIEVRNNPYVKNNQNFKIFLFLIFFPCC